MAEYAANVLKTESLYYRLSRATLRDGILHISANGSAETEVTSLQLTNLTEYFRVAYIADKYCDSYEANIRIYVYAKDKDGRSYNYTFFPCDTHGNMFLQEFQIKAIAYEKLTWRIESDVAVNISLWELCPEAEDINVQTIIDGVNQSLPRLLYDYNTWPLTVEMGEATVGLITFRLIDKTDLQGHFIMSFYASEAAILTVRFYTNEIEELFAPLNYDIRKGYNSIGIPHCYLHRSAGLYSVMATAQVSAGIITIPTRGVLYSIDGGYLAKRELDAALDVRDLAIRQLSNAYGPDEVWLIGIDAGEVLVRKRDYNEINPNVAWTAVLSLGKGLDAAIEFNGVWALRQGANQFTIHTEEFPWLFWVDMDGNLFGCNYVPDEDHLPILLDTGVTGSLHACRGYSAQEHPERDQGLIICYMKDDHAYYRSYSYNTTAQKVIWEEAQQIGIEVPNLTNVNVHRLNDYRIAFEFSGDVNIWVLSERTFVGQSAYPEVYYAPRMFSDEEFSSALVYLPSAYQPPTIAVIDQEKEIYTAYDEYWGEDRQFTRLSVVLDHLLWSSETSYPIKKRFTFSSDLPSDIRNISWEVDEISQTTHIEFLFGGVPSSHKSTITIGASDNYRLADGELVLIGLGQSIPIIWDDTIYTTLVQPGEAARLGQNQHLTLQYLSIRYPKFRGNEQYSLVNEHLDLIYSTVRYTTTRNEEQYSMNNVSILVWYYSAGDEPI